MQISNLEKVWIKPPPPLPPHNPHPPLPPSLYRKKAGRSASSNLINLENKLQESCAIETKTFESFISI